MEHSICPAGNTLGIEMLPHTGTKSRSTSSAENEVVGGGVGEGETVKSVNIQGKRYRLVIDFHSLIKV